MSYGESYTKERSIQGNYVKLVNILSTSTLEKGRVKADRVDPG